MKRIEVLEKLSEDEINDIIEKRLSTLKSRTDKEYFREFMKSLIRKKSAPPQIFQDIPVKSDVAGKTRFDQIYDAVMFISYPEYSEIVQKQLSETPDPDIKVWKAMFDRKYKVSSILLKAKTYQEAFCLASDYLCRISLRLFQVAPLDATVRVSYCSDKYLRRYYSIRTASKQKRRAIHNTKEKLFTPKQVNGARLAALGFSPSQQERSVVKYAEYKDILRIQKSGSTKVSSILGETFKKEDEYD